MPYRNDDHCTCTACKLHKAEVECDRLRALPREVRRYVVVFYDEYGDAEEGKTLLVRIDAALEGRDVQS